MYNMVLVWTKGVSGRAALSLFPKQCCQLACLIMKKSCKSGTFSTFGTNFSPPPPQSFGKLPYSKVGNPAPPPPGEKPIQELHAGFWSCHVRFFHNRRVEREREVGGVIASWHDTRRFAAAAAAAAAAAVVASSSSSSSSHFSTNASFFLFPFLRVPGCV